MLGLTGNLGFGRVQVGDRATATVTVSNSGNALLTITGIAVSNAPTVFSISWTHGTIPPGGSQPITVQFAPTVAQTYNGSFVVSGDQTAGANTLPVSGTGVSASPTMTQTQFGDGEYLVGSQILPGRYFAAPGAGCSWARELGTDGTPFQILASAVLTFSAPQWIVDILPTDKAFKSTSCGAWVKDSPHGGTQASISKGMWLVGAQVAPGTYSATAQSGCYWERLRNFEGTSSGIIASNVSASSGTALVTIASGDAGFDTNPACGTWTRMGTSASAP